jgi:molecular chaperone HtpG
MVASKVEIITLSHTKMNLQHTGFVMVAQILEPADKTTRGTEIILHIAEDSLEFLEESKITGL